MGSQTEVIKSRACSHSERQLRIVIVALIAEVKIVVCITIM